MVGFLRQQRQHHTHHESAGHGLGNYESSLSPSHREVQRESPGVHTTTLHLKKLAASAGISPKPCFSRGNAGPMVPTGTYYNTAAWVWQPTDVQL